MERNGGWKVAREEGTECEKRRRRKMGARRTAKKMRTRKERRRECEVGQEIWTVMKGAYRRERCRRWRESGQCRRRQGCLR
jgi:hypothetical protein